MKKEFETFENALISLDMDQLQEINGGGAYTFLGPVGVAVGIASGLVGLYEFGYNYAKRHLEK